MKLRIILPTLIILAFSIKGKTQSTSVKLDNLIEICDKEIQYTDSLLKDVKKAKAQTSMGDIAFSDAFDEESPADSFQRVFLFNVAGFYYRAVPLFEYLMINGNETEKNAARYFKLLSTYEVGWANYQLSARSEAITYFDKIEPEMDYFSQSSNGPIRYKLKGQDMSLPFSNYEPMTCYYYYFFGNALSDEGKYIKSNKFMKHGLSLHCLPELEKFIGYNVLVANKIGLGQHDLEGAEYAATTLSAYNSISTYVKSTITHPEYAINNSIKLLKNINMTSLPNAELGGFYYTAATEVEKLDTLNTAAAGFYAVALTRGNRTITELKHIIAFAKTNNLTDLRISAVLQFAERVPRDDCYGMNDVAEELRGIGETAKANDFERQYAKCRRENERAKKKAARRPDYSFHESGGNFHFYAGFNITGIMNAPAKMDFGGDMAFLFKRVGFDFSFLRIRQNKEWATDVQNEPSRYWDGYRSYIGFKGIGGKKAVHWGYGPQFGFAYKQLNPIFASVTGASTNNDYTFNATEKQYHFLMNVDIYVFYKWFGSHFFTGFGFSYNKFDGGLPYYNNSAYVIGDPILAERHSNRFAFQARAGISIGFHAGKKPR